MRLNQIRKQRQMSLCELKKLTGISVPYLSELSHNKKMPSVDIAFKIAKALDTTIEYLMEYYTENEIDFSIRLQYENLELKRKLKQINKLSESD